MSNLMTLFIVFAEPGFPRLDVGELPAIPGAVETHTVAELRVALQPDRVLIWRHGSAFPTDAWEPLKRFLDEGGSLLYLGGEPFTRPVTGEAGARVIQPRNLAMLKALRLNQCYRLGIAGARLMPIGVCRDEWPARILGTDAWAAVLEPRLCDTRDFPAEDGTPGSRDATVTPLAHLFATGEDRFAAAAAAIAIDRLRGPWAGGRWVFWLASVPPTEAELGSLLRKAAGRPVEFHVDPTFGCFHEGERPSVMLRLHRPRAAGVEDFDVTLSATLPDGSKRHCGQARMRVGEHGSTRVALDLDAKPGLYRVTATATLMSTTPPEAANSKLETRNLKLSIEASSGFWVFDPALFASGGKLELDAYTLRRDGRPEPVVGTTLMSGSVQRKFLFEPNVAEWDDAFAELASLKLNLVRTGVWSGWRKISAEPGAVDEAWLRALEAFYLTARKHGIPVMFTFFAFLPEAFGGENPYFDPRATEGQRAYVSAVASRFAGVKEILWDLINEPSFSSPKQLWKCRPHGDEFEMKAFLKWLQARYAPAGVKAEDKAWEDEVRARWRLAPDDKIELPVDEDFDDRTVFDKRRPYRAAEYMHFAQDAFAGWARDMTAAIRQAGSTAPVTVGQDEGGLTQRPSPLFHHDAVDFTSMHTWWLNDALLWDGLAAKTGGKPLLISETGIMQRELLSGEALREPEDFARLLSRKIGYAFAAGAFGVVQWCYDVNPYMASDNEVAIGLKRVDGSYKPEHRVLREFAEFVFRNRERFESPLEPDVVVVVPSAEQFSARDQATAAVRRSVDALTRELGIFPRLVPDHRIPTDLARPMAIILPANRGVSDATGQALTEVAERGGVVICSGWFETDEVGIAAARLGLQRRPLGHMEQVEGAAGGSRYELRFTRSETESWYAAAGDPMPTRKPLGSAAVWHHPVPLEWSDHPSALGDFYATGLRDSGIEPRPKPLDAAPGLTIRHLRFRDSVLVIAVNESSRPQVVPTSAGSDSFEVPASEAAMVFTDPRTGRTLDHWPQGR